jgi:hypothetical protein
VRFEVALRTINPNLEVLAPVRDQSFVRSAGRWIRILDQPRTLGSLDWGQGNTGFARLNP